MCVPPLACSKESAKQVRWLVQAYRNDETCRSLSQAVLSSRDASSQQQVAGMQLCSSDIESSFLLIANTQQHDTAQETDSPSRRRQMFHAGSLCPKIKSSFHVSSSYVQELKKSVQLCIQDTVCLSTSSILLDMRFSDSNWRLKVLEKANPF